MYLIINVSLSYHLHYCYHVMQCHSSSFARVLAHQVGVEGSVQGPERQRLRLPGCGAVGICQVKKILPFEGEFTMGAPVEQARLVKCGTRHGGFQLVMDPKNAGWFLLWKILCK